MSLSLEDLNRQVGLSLATHVWTTTVASKAFIAAPSTGKRIVLRYIAMFESAVASTRLTDGTTGGITHYFYPGSGPHAEECRIPCTDGTALTLHTTAGGGNGCIRVYYNIELNG